MIVDEAGASHVGGDEDDEGKRRNDEQHVCYEGQHAVGDASQVGGADADDHRDSRREAADCYRDDERLPRPVDELGEDVLAESGRAEPVSSGGLQGRVEGGRGVAVRGDLPGEDRHHHEDEQQQGAGGGLPVVPDRPPQVRAGPGPTPPGDNLVRRRGRLQRHPGKRHRQPTSFTSARLTLVSPSPTARECAGRAPRWRRRRGEQPRARRR